MGQTFFYLDARFAYVTQTLLCIFGKAAAQQVVDNIGSLCGKCVPLRISSHHCGQSIGKRFAAERLLAREHFKQHASECPNV